MLKIPSFKSLSCLLASTLTLLGAGCSEQVVDKQAIHQLYKQGVSKPAGGQSVFHIGHSLVGRDMPSMIEQLAGNGHSHKSQLGWGTSLKQHWEPDEDILGFEVENNHPNFMDLNTAIESSEFDVFVLTEMVEIKDAIKYHKSAVYLAKFAEKIIASNPESKIYFYESWHHVNDKDGWTNRLSNDFETQWIDRILYPSLAKTDYQIPIYIIPVGQVLLALFDSQSTKIPGKSIDGPEAIFQRDDKGVLDAIHVNALGNYIVALTHYSVIYQKSPVGLPNQLLLADGSKAAAPDQETADHIQNIVWETVSQECRTGIIKC